jgi:DNA processing protein
MLGLTKQFFRINAMNDRQVLIALHLTGVIGPRRLLSLRSAFPNLSDVFGATEDQLAFLPNWTTSVARKVLSFKNPQNTVDQEVERATSHGINLLVEGDSSFPEVFKDLYDPPFILWMRGQYLPEDEKALAVVGCRKPSAYGKNVASKLACDLAQAGYTIVSGLARGIDSLAHLGALRFPKGRTLAFLGSGLLNLYPPENKKISEQIVDRGALFSEYPLNGKPLGLHFPQRNRLISGASRGVLVVEANKNSGSFITVDHAIDQGRPVFAVPGPVDHSQSEGTHSLIQQGAKLVTQVNDIFEELNDRKAEKIYKSQKSFAVSFVPPDVTEEEKLLLDRIGDTPVHVDALSREVGISSRRLNEILLVLEIKNLVEQTPGHCFLKI